MAQTADEPAAKAAETPTPGVAPRFRDCSLVILGHGSAQNAGASRPVRQHAEEISRRGLFASVQAAYWKQEPRLETVLEQTSTPWQLLVPLFVSGGYFSETIIPRALGFRPGADWEAGSGRVRHPHAERPGLVYCRPVGTHPAITGVLLARAREAVREHPFPQAPKETEISLVIAGHGTPQDSRSRMAIEQQVEAIRGLGFYASVDAVYIEEQPTIGECYGLARTRNIVLVPFFISEGMHTAEDLPLLLGAPGEMVRRRLAAGHPAWRNPTEARGKRLWLAAAAGTHVGLADAIVQRAEEGLAWIR